MASNPDWKQFLEAGMEFTAVRRAEARRLAKDLVSQGQLAQERVQAFVDEVVDSSRARTDKLLEIIRAEVQRQMRQVGVATKDDIGRLRARLIGRPAKKAAKKRAAKKPAKKKAAARKPAKKTAAKKKTAARKPAKKTAAKKKTAARKPAKKTARRA